MNKIKKCIIVSLLMTILMMTILMPHAGGLDIKVQNLPNEVAENSDVNLEFEISDYSYAGYISIDTGIVKNGNEPIFDFGELNEKYVGVDRYKQKVIIDIPKDLNNFKVKISGKSPSGIEMSKIGNIEIAKFIDENQKYYEVKLLGNNKEDLGKKDKDSKLFKLIVNEKVLFEKELKNIKSDDLEETKTIAIDMFNRGLTKDAKKLIFALEKIKLDGQGILPYKEMYKNILLAIIIIIIYLIGYAIGQRCGESYEQ